VKSEYFGDTVPGGYATKAGVNGTVTASGRQLILTATTTANDSAGQGIGLHWKGDLGVYFQSIQALNTLTTSKIEIGLTDATGDDGAVATKATPTGTADDFCVLIRDTNDNTELDLISELDNGGPVANAENVHAVVAATNFNTEFKYVNDIVTAYVNKRQVGSGSMQGGDLCTPWWYVQSRAAAVTRILTVEFFICAGPSGIVAPW
jgi:hypothetical protein